MSRKIKHFIKKYRYGVAFFCILFLAFLLRAKDYLHGDFNYFIDQARDLLLTKDIVYTKHVTLIGGRAGLGGVFHGPLWLYMLVPTFIFSHGNPFWTLVPVFLIVNLGVVVLIYLLAAKLYSKKVGLLSALFVATSGSFIESSFITSNAQVMPLIFLLFLYCVIKYLRGRDVYIMWSLLLIGLGFHFESAFAVFLFPLLIVAYILKRKFPQWKYLIIGSILFLISVSNFLFFELRHQFLMTQSVWKLASGKMGKMGDYEQLANIWYRIYDRLLGLVQYYFRPLFEQNIGSMLFISIVIVYAIYEFYRQVRAKQRLQEQDKEYIFIGLVPVLYFILYILYPFPLWIHYNIALIVPSSLFLALSIRKIYRLQYAHYIIGLLFILIMLPPAGWLVNQYIGEQRDAIYNASYKHQKEVADYIFQDAQGKEFGYLIYDSGGLTYNMDYLMWYLNNKYQAHASNDKRALTYLIMYPPPKWNPGAQGYWKERVVNTKAPVVERKKFADSNIVVEKLNISTSEKPVDPNYYQNLIFR